ncbi:MAG: Gfo/Idh/MocA family oxidoreductase [Verrucomicrobia bacterium]|nr:MAG: Gfo/Idh/MocA family oxidoreductase [Verrucomicrobiota bacterium]
MCAQPIRIGIVGAGTNTRAKHIPGLQALPGVEIGCVCNRTRSSGEAVAREFGIPRVHEKWADVVADSNVDAVVIGTWPYLHAPITLAALAAGKHVLTEARMAMDATEARAMRAAAQAHPHLVAQVVPAPFSLGVDKAIRRLLAEKFIGDLLAIEHRDAGGWLDRDAPLTWRKDRNLSGLNVMMLGIVCEMIIRWVGEATLVTALAKTFIKQRRDAVGKLQDVLIPDHLDVLADLACGAQLRLRQSSVAALDEGPGTWLFGSDGTLRFYDGKLFCARRGEQALCPIEIPPHERGGWRVEEEFINAIRGKEPVRLTTFTDGVKYMEFTEAVARSLETRCAIPLPLRP